jgi:hypothetical protein
MRNALLVTLLAVGSALLTQACAMDGTDAGAQDTQADDLAKGTNDQWIYSGPLPALESPTITVSQTAHTARVTGLVPKSFAGEIPFYAMTTALPTGRTELTVVYPVATGAASNAQPASYVISVASPWVPTNDHATWGGFPFIPYDQARGIAFHGPITAADGEWKLIRGPVSHGCNRMQGEHVVELANLIGVDMSTRIYKGTGVTGLHVPVTVIHKTDVYQGKNVDVDYPALATVQRPHANVQMFRTWSSDDFPALVCSLDKKHLNGATKVPSDYCEGRFQNKYDLAVGPSK